MKELFRRAFGSKKLFSKS